MTEYGCKVCRVLDERDMVRYEDQLVHHWQADPPKRKGYRQLADWLNTTMLRREMDRAGLSTLGEEATSKYERLRESDDTVGQEIAKELAGAGIDIDRLEDDFVSYGVVRTHLTECLGLEHEIQPGDWETDSIEITQRYAAKKVTEAVRSLNNKQDIAGGDISIHINIELECESCHSKIPVERVLRRQQLCNCGE